MDRFVALGGQGRPGGRAPSPRADDGEPAAPRIQVQRVPTGWIDEAAGKLKLKGISAAAGGIVFVTKPELEYFLRGSRKRAPAKLAAVFEHELVKVITPAVAWQPKGGPPDIVCLSCFTLLKFMEHGTERLVNHCIECRGKEYCLQYEGLVKAEGSVSPEWGAHRRAIVISARPVSGQAEKAEPAAPGRRRRQSPRRGAGRGGRARQRGRGREGREETAPRRPRGRGAGEEPARPRGRKSRKFRGRAKPPGRQSCMFNINP